MDRGELRPRPLAEEPSTFRPHGLAAIPGATFAPNVATFDNNLVSTFHIFQAAKLFKIHNLVWASSETLLGYPFNNPPACVPLDENLPPYPRSCTP
jgi:nucleoside-diphosphate-sugar epimerase